MPGAAQEELERINEPAGLELLFQWTFAQSYCMHASCLSWNKVAIPPSARLLAQPIACQARQTVACEALRVRAWASALTAAWGAPQVKTDVLAVGYSHQELNIKNPGRIALWSLKNPGHPLWEFATPACITSVNFSQQNPHLLAAGCFDGSVCIYDAKLRQVGCSTQDRGLCRQQVYAATHDS